MKFIAIFEMPHAKLDEWMQLPEEERKAQEQQMQGEWNRWQETHGSAIIETVGVGKPVRITADGATDTRNDIMMYTIVEAESPEAATAMFVGHPHFGIPESWIEVMPLNQNMG